jgi:excisionase family DNA binding protein
MLVKPPGSPRLVDFKTGMQYGGWRRSKTYRLIEEEKIVAKKDGRQTLIDLDSIDAYKRSLPKLAIGQRRSA